MESTPAAMAAPLRLMENAPSSPAGPGVGSRSAVAIPALAATAAILAFFLIDIPLARSVRAHELPDLLQKFLEAAEHFGTFYGESLILLLLFVLEPARRRGLFRIAGAAWAAGLACNVAKLLVGRCRPKYFDFDHVTSAHGFLGLFTFGAGGSKHQGFPSAHTATAIAFCVALSHAHPRGRWVFFLLAVLVGLQRIDTSSHFASDVIAGGLLGWLVAQPFVNGGRLSRAFDRYEAGLP